MGNPEPIFLCTPARTSRAKIVGKKHLRARFHDDQYALDGIGFSMSESKDLLEEGPVAVAFVPKQSTRQGRNRLELHIKDLRRASDDVPDEIRYTASPEVLENPDEITGAESEPDGEPDPIQTDALDDSPRGR